MQSFLESSL